MEGWKRRVAGVRVRLGGGDGGGGGGGGDGDGGGGGGGADGEGGGGEGGGGGGDGGAEGEGGCGGGDGGGDGDWHVIARVDQSYGQTVLGDNASWISRLLQSLSEGVLKNMLDIADVTVTLPRSKASGWLNAIAECSMLSK